MLKQARQAGQQAGQRLLKKHLRLGITGLSGAGKTALITSLVHQLMRPDASTTLTLWPLAHEGRLLGAQILPPMDISQPRFPFEVNQQQLLAGEWPASTTGYSQLSLKIRVKQSHSLLKHLSDVQELQLDLIDYPGEWLLDLPMLQQDYSRWSLQSWQRFELPIYQALSQRLRIDLELILQQGCTELTLGQAVQRYTSFLQQLRSQNALILQPGRLLQPGHLRDTPLLNLLPLPDDLLKRYPAWAQRLQQQFKSYCDQVILPFYRQYFAGLDRQIVLVDCLSVLNHGYQSLVELQQALFQIQQHFHYGPQRWWHRLFAPRIDKVAIVASKADQLTVEQHRNLSLLLQQLLQQSQAQQKFDGCESMVLVAASVICSEQGLVDTPQGPQPCLQGIAKQNKQRITLFPGDVPLSMPSEILFEHHQFNFPELLPKGNAIDAMRFDQLLQFLLGDRLR